MKSENQSNLTKTLLGYFMSEDCSGDCLIVDFAYATESLGFFTGGEENPQFVIPNDTELGLMLPRFCELGYIPTGVYPSLKLKLNEMNKEGIPRFVDIPVYAKFKDDYCVTVYVEIDEWIPALEIEDIDYEHPEPQIKFIENSANISENFIGYVTATGGGILACDIDFVKMCRSYHDYVNTQIVVPPDGEDAPGFHAGVFAPISPELANKEFPVYGEYDGTFLKRFTIKVENFE